MYHEKIIKVPLYPCMLGIMFTDDIEKQEEYFVKHKDYENAYEGLTPFATTYRTNYKTKANVLICINPNADKYTRGLVTHEVSHAVDLIFSRIGCEEQTGEPRAYLSQWIADEIYKFADKLNLKV